MATNQHEQKSTAELRQMKKTLLTVVFTVAVIELVVVAWLVYRIYRQQDDNFLLLTFVPMTVAVGMLPALIQIGAINKTLAARGEQL